jgi:Rhodopirellula transposase DDE domain
MSEQKWVRRSLRHWGERLTDLGQSISPPTVGRWLRKLGYALRVKVKKHEASAAHPQRHEQCEHIQVQKQRCQAAGWPIISVDTKQKELIGNCKNAGHLGGQRPEEVKVHDCPSEASVRAVPYSIYAVSRKRGAVYVGLSADSPACAVTAIAHWWEEEGQLAYPQADQLLILAAAGGSHGCRARSFKQQLQEQLSAR